MRPVTARAGLLLLVLLLPAVGFTACERRPNVPEQVTVVVEKYRPLPTWATAPLDKPQPADGTVGERVRSEHARGVVIDLANCHRRLLGLLDKGEPVDDAECSR
jgi:D-alanyl-D-alanine dipeptidase